MIKSFSFFFINIINNSSRSEVSDQKLQKIESNEVGCNIEWDCLYWVDIGEDKYACEGPSDLFMEDHFVYDGVVDSA